jgi:plastocyanin
MVQMRLLTIACVCLLGFTGMGAGGAGESHDVSIANIQYSPASVTIKAGDSVTWTNHDERDHTVIAQDGSFSSPVIRRGESFTFQFDKAGKYPYGCKLHPRMKGTIIVLPPK